MKRRQIVLGAGSLILGNTFVAQTVSAAAPEHEEYSRESYEQAVADGKPFMLDFFASW